MQKRVAGHEDEAELTTQRESRMSFCTNSADALAADARLIATLSIARDRSSPTVGRPSNEIGILSWPVPQTSSSTRRPAAARGRDRTAGALRQARARRRDQGDRRNQTPRQPTSTMRSTTIRGNTLKGIDTIDPTYQCRRWQWANDGTAKQTFDGVVTQDLPGNARIRSTRD